jgi:hypothetical protein
VVHRAVVVGFAAVILSCAAACGAKPNVAVHMIPGSVADECTQMARYKVESDRKLIQGDSGGIPTQHDLLVSLAVINQAADQLPTDDPVRVAALRYDAHGTTYPYFSPCRRIWNLAGAGRIPVPR